MKVNLEKQKFVTSLDELKMEGESTISQGLIGSYIGWLIKMTWNVELSFSRGYLKIPMFSQRNGHIVSLSVFDRKVKTQAS